MTGVFMNINCQTFTLTEQLELLGTIVHLNNTT